MSDNPIRNLLEKQITDAFWNGSPDNLFLLRCEENDFVLEAINRSQARILGMHYDSFSPLSLRQAAPDQLYDRLTANYQRCLELKSQISYEEPFHHPDGSFSYWETSLIPLADEHGNILRIAGRSRNITDLRNTRQALKEERQELEKARNVKMAFLANMSHEIRTPLNGISGALPLFLDAEDREEQKELADTLSSAVEQITRLTEDILDYAKLNAGTLSLQNSTFAPLSVQEEVVRMLSGLAQQKCVRVTPYHTLPADMYLEGDQGRFRQIMLNLVSNAIKFSPGGCVHIRMNYTVPDQLTLEVEDNGIGIRADLQESLFQPFTQIDNSATRKHEGSGLGLSICHELATLMGGRIHLNSSEGQGSIFTVSLPLRRQKYQPETKTAAKSVQLKGHVLLVEDNPTNILIARKLLRRIGLRVSEAEDGQLALEQCRQQTFDLILMDWHMPVMDGLECTSRIRCQTQWKNTSTPVIGLTANVMEEQRQQCLQAGMNDIIAKPVRQEKLLQVLSGYLSEAEGLN